MWPERFEEYVSRKRRRAERAAIPGFRTSEDHSAAFRLKTIGNAWSFALFDGPFYTSSNTDPGLPSVNLVFVQSREGNTGTDSPASLGGGDTDAHLVYEGLSRVCADGVLAGAGTIAGTDLVLSVWHPEMVRLRSACGLPRHPVQIVVSARGRLDLARLLMFNVPELRVCLITTDEGARTFAAAATGRPWVTVVSSGPSLDLRRGLSTLRRELGITSISAIGGRTLATTLIDDGLVQDLYLTTSPQSGGEPNTPYYTGKGFNKALCLRKEGRDADAGVVFEHLVI